MGLLTKEEHDWLREVLLKLNIGHNILLSGLDESLKWKIETSGNYIEQMESLINVVDGDSGQRADGGWPIVIVIENAINIDANSKISRELSNFLQNIQYRMIRSENLPLKIGSEQNSVNILGNPEILDMLRKIQSMVVSEMNHFRLVKNIIRYHGVLNNIDISCNMRDSVLRGLRDDIHDVHEWIDNARNEASNAASAFDRCLRDINRGNLTSAYVEIEIACKECEKLNFRLMRIIDENSRL